MTMKIRLLIFTFIVSTLGMFVFTTDVDAKGYRVNLYYEESSKTLKIDELKDKAVLLDESINLNLTDLTGNPFEDDVPQED